TPELPRRLRKRGAYLRPGLGATSLASAPPALYPVRYLDRTHDCWCGRSLGIRTLAGNQRSRPTLGSGLDGPCTDPAGLLRLRRSVCHGRVERTPGTQQSADEAGESDGRYSNAAGGGL